MDSWDRDQVGDRLHERLNHAAHATGIEFRNKSLHEARSKLETVNPTFCPDPKTIGAEFTATYEADAKENFAAVNAGDYSFNVRGGALNG